MLPLRYNFISFGGSYAQRQVLNLTMIQAAINAKKLKLALQLVSELKVCVCVCACVHVCVHECVCVCV